MKTGLFAALSLIAAPLAAQEVGIPAGCELRATLLMPNCEMHQVMHCDGGVIRTDVYADSIFKGEEQRAGLTAIVWRRGTMLQEVTAQIGDLNAVPALGVGETLVVQVERSRRILGDDGGPWVEPFTLTYERIGSAERELPSGQVIAVTQYREMSAGTGHEAVDLVVDYSPVFRVPVWREGQLIDPNGAPSSYSDGIAAFYAPEHPAFQTAIAPEDAPCTPEG